MCFVSFVPQPKGFLLGSNRDEHHGRKTALSPCILESKPGKLAMPVDGKAGGTWIALRNDGVSAVLLNGAFENHVRQPFYRHSRGVIIPQIMESADPNESFATFFLENIEPFTLVTVTDCLTEWRWDGLKLHRQQPDFTRPHCWSSATLYDAAQQAIRQQWFMDALQSDRIYNSETLLRWQSTGGYGPKNTDIVLERTDGIGTVSTTVITAMENTLEMAYEDYLSPVPQVVSLLDPPLLVHEEKESLQKVY